MIKRIKSSPDIYPFMENLNVQKSIDNAEYTRISIKYPKKNLRLNESFYIFQVNILVHQYNLKHKQKHSIRSKHVATLTVIILTYLVLFQLIDYTSASIRISINRFSASISRRLIDG